MFRPVIFCLFVIAALCAASSGQTTPRSSSRPRQPLPSGAHAQSSRAPAGSHAGQEIRLKPFSVQDPQLGIEAFRFLMPADWRVQGGVVWRANPSRPATVSIRIYNPAGVEEIGAVPDIPCVWAATLPAFGFPVGSFYLGNEVRPPMGDAIAALRRLILPRYSSQFGPFQVVKQELLPEMAQAVAAANYPELRGLAKFSGGKIRIAYQHAGKAVEMDVYAIVGQWTTPIQGVPMTFWGADGIRYSRAAKGKLDEQFKLFQTVLYSEKLNIHWLNLYSQIQNMMTQRQMEASNRAVELSRYLSRTNNQISKGIRRSYEQRQAAMDRAAAKFDQYIRGVEEYRNPFKGEAVELPSGYRNVWANASGDYILSDNSNFNPNVASNHEWRPLQRQP
jgi:hypothetical protein